MKKFLWKCLSFFLIFVISTANLSNLIFATNTSHNIPSEFRGIWISFLDLKPLLYKTTKQKFIENINKMLDNIQSLKLTDVILHVRSFSDSIYKSDIFPWSDMLTGKQGIAPDYDPLKIIIDLAHKRNLRLHAWVNPYRIINNANVNTLSDDNPAKKWILSNDHNFIIKTDTGAIYYNPASIEVMKLIIRGIKELVYNYDIDGVHMDDYFYPSDNKLIDQEIYDKYKSNGGKLSLDNWRLEKVNLLIRSVYKSIKNINPKISFGISPCGIIDNNYSVHYADVKTWLSKPGYIDYLCPQIYFGFNHSTSRYDEILNQWSNLKILDNISLYAGLAAYKINNEDHFAGSGCNEWINSHDILKKQVLSLRRNFKYNGFTIFRYGSLFLPNDLDRDAVNLEIKELLSILYN